MPLFPLHTWLPDAHTQAPTAGSVVLAGVMLKLGTYGFLRFGLYLFPEASVWSRELWLTLAVIGIIYGALAATMQKDLKRLVAYSSVAHLGFIVLGTFAFTTQAITGSVLQMVNHGVSTGALFLFVGWIYERRKTRQIAELNGLQKVAPIFAAGFLVVMLSSIGVPGLNGFIGEYLILLGSFTTARWWTVVATAGVILAALYLLWAYQRVFHGEPDDDNKSFPELRFKEGLVLIPFLVAIVFVGVYPKPLLDRIEPSVERLVVHVAANSDIEADPDYTTQFGVPDDLHGGEEEGGGGLMHVLAQSDPNELDPEVWWFALSPLLVLVGGALFLMVVGALTPKWPKGLYAFVTATIAGAAGVLAIFNWDDISDNGPTTLVAGALAFDTFAMWSTITISAVVILVSMLTDEYIRDTPNDGPEVYALYLAAATGGIVMASANDLIVLFLGLETLSLALYVLAASNRRSDASAESGLKYFILGGFASAFFLYGIALDLRRDRVDQHLRDGRRRRTPRRQ